MQSKAIAEYAKAISINPKLADAQYNLGLAYYYKKKYNLAKFHFDKALEHGYEVDPN